MVWYGMVCRVVSVPCTSRHASSPSMKFYVTTPSHDESLQLLYMERAECTKRVEEWKRVVKNINECDKIKDVKIKKTILSIFSKLYKEGGKIIEGRGKRKPNCLNKSWFGPMNMGHPIQSPYSIGPHKDRIITHLYI